MKLIVLTLMTFLSLNLAQASTKQEKIDLLKCLRKTINSKRMNQESINQTFALIESYNHYNAKELEQECKNNHKKFKYIPKTKFKTMIEYAYKIRTNNYHAYRILTDLINNPTYCQAITAEADLALGVGMGTGLSLGYCQSANGRIWAMVAPELTIHIGGGAAVLFGKSKFYLPNRRMIDDQSDELVYTLGLGVAASTNLQSDRIAIGAGVGLMLSGEQNFILKLIPVGQNFKELLDTLDNI